MDKVIIRDLLVRGIIGVNDWERKRAQDILINITLFTDTRRAAETDSIVDCVDYSKMSKRIQAHAESAERLTVEALANDLVKICSRIKAYKKSSASGEARSSAVCKNRSAWRSSAAAGSSHALGVPESWLEYPARGEFAQGSLSYFRNTGKFTMSQEPGSRKPWDPRAEFPQCLCGVYHPPLAGGSKRKSHSPHRDKACKEKKCR